MANKFLFARSRGIFQMPCTVAKHAGFCMGVRQAVEKAERAAAQAQERGIPCYSLGEVVHNPLVTSRLQQTGRAGG